uniref:Uncharacterized protein n=1 Tax=Anguilla anguilla TaxID=7936 RepID=A0A0E9VZE9_ANGAN
MDNAPPQSAGAAGLLRNPPSVGGVPRTANLLKNIC